MTALVGSILFTMGFLFSLLVGFLRSLFAAPAQTIAAAQVATTWFVGWILNLTWLVGSTAWTLVQAPFWLGVRQGARLRGRIKSWRAEVDAERSARLSPCPGPLGDPIMSDGSNAVE